MTTHQEMEEIFKINRQLHQKKEDIIYQSKISTSNEAIEICKIIYDLFFAAKFDAKPVLSPVGISNREEFKASHKYNQLANFVKKYGKNYSRDDLRKLKELLDFKEINFSDEQLEKLILSEKLEQDRLSFKNLIGSCLPDCYKDYIKIFVKTFVREIDFLKESNDKVNNHKFSGTQNDVVEIMGHVNNFAEKVVAFKEIMAEGNIVPQSEDEKNITDANLVRLILNTKDEIELRENGKASYLFLEKDAPGDLRDVAFGKTKKAEEVLAHIKDILKYSLESKGPIDFGKLANAFDKNNNSIGELRTRYFRKEPEAIGEYCSRILLYSKYPDTFPKKFDIVYNPETKMLLLDYYLPAKEAFPVLKEVKYVAARKEYKAKLLTEMAFNKMYDNVLYQIVLRVMRELYDADVVNAVDAIILNGLVSFVDKGTGHKVTSCIISISTKKDEFKAINLSEVDPKECFKKLKGVGSSKLHGLAPVTPIMIFNKEDKRFISPRNVIGGVGDATNLAAMDWQDFENLIRDLFEKEFCASGGEVKITRASRDEGVDAVIFDPDPIKGGKIIVQAKRYTNTVGLSAVRDLYGTVINEGAMKGILITTADYGPDAYDFSKDKPLTLLNGGHLLHLLDKHGHKAKIDIEEARNILNEQKET